MTSPNPPRRQRALRVWRDTPSWLRTATVYSLSIALSLFALGIIADALNWSASEWGYFVNLYSSVTAFFVAVPIALIGLDAVTESRRSQSERSSVNNQTIKSWNRFSTAVEEYYTSDVIDVLTTRWQLPYRAYAEVRKEIRDYIEAQPAGNRTASNPYPPTHEAGHDAAGYLALRARIEYAKKEVEDGLGDIVALLPLESDIQIRWTLLRAKWRFISTEVLVKRDALDLLSVPDTTVAVIDNRTVDDQHPLSGFYYSKRRSNQIPYRVDRMGDVPVILQSLLDMTEQVLLNTVGSSTLNPIASVTDGAETFVEDATKSKSKLDELQRTVAAVDINRIAI